MKIPFPYRILLLAVTFFLAQTGLAQKPDTLTILHVNDTHSNLAPIGPRNASLDGSFGGAARAATVIGLTKMQEKNVLTLHAGDFSIGDIFYNLYFGVPELKLMQQLGFDAVTPGNHEFDLTPAVLQMVLDTAFAQGTPVPLISANLVLTAPAVQGLKKWVQPYITKQYGNIKVGIFGMTTPATNLLSQPAPAFVDTLVVQTAAATVGALQAAGCNVIICLSHLGVYLDRIVASYVPGIRIIIGGHDHLKYFMPVKNPAGDSTWLVQAGSFYSHVGKMKIVSGGGGKIRFLQQGFVALDTAIPEEPTVAGMVNLMKQDIEQRTKIPFFSQKVTTANATFGEVPDSLTFAGYHDTPVGNLVTDAFRAFGKTDIAIEAGGSTAQPLYQGPVTFGDIFRVVGYGFNTSNGLGYRMATFNIVGAALAVGLEFGVSEIETDDEFLLQSSGMSYIYDPSKPVGSRILGAAVGGKPLELTRSYSVTANEFTLVFLQYLKLPVSNVVIHGDTTEFMVLAGYLSQFPAGISPARRTSIIAPVYREQSALPATPSLDQNYPNPFGPGVGHPSTSITFELPRSGDVTVKIYNLLGEEVRTLVDHRMEAGRYTIPFRADGLTAGAYLYRLTTGSATVVKKLVVVK